MPQGCFVQNLVWYELTILALKGDGFQKLFNAFSPFKKYILLIFGPSVIKLLISISQ